MLCVKLDELNCRYHAVIERHPGNSAVVSYVHTIPVYSTRTHTRTHTHAHTHTQHTHTYGHSHTHSLGQFLQQLHRGHARTHTLAACTLLVSSVGRAGAERARRDERSLRVHGCLFQCQSRGETVNIWSFFSSAGRSALLGDEQWRWVRIRFNFKVFSS